MVEKNVHHIIYETEPMFSMEEEHIWKLLKCIYVAAKSNFSILGVF